MKNEKTIIRQVAEKYLQYTEAELLVITGEILSEIIKTALEGDKVLWKNFGTFQLKNKKQRRRYDQGLKAVVETPPKKVLQFINSPNIFRNV